VSTLLQAFSEAPAHNQPNFNALIGDIFEKKTFQKGSILFEPEQLGNELYILETGELILTLPTANEENHVLETLIPGTMVFNCLPCISRCIL
jgi:CRP-like cAMP-binding protein